MIAIGIPYSAWDYASGSSIADPSGSIIMKDDGLAILVRAASRRNGILGEIAGA